MAVKNVLAIIGFVTVCRYMYKGYVRFLQDPLEERIATIFEQETRRRRDATKETKNGIQ